MNGRPTKSIQTKDKAIERQTRDTNKQKTVGTPPAVCGLAQFDMESAFAIENITGATYETNLISEQKPKIDKNHCRKNEMKLRLKRRRCY